MELRQSCGARSRTRSRPVALAATLGLTIILCWGASAGRDSRDAQPGDVTHRTLVGPNILVSTDGASAHAELLVAAHPENPEQLLGAAIDLKAGNRTYVSVDGGYRWLETSPGGDFRYKYASADPQVAFSRRGTALFVSMDNPNVYSGESKLGGNLHLYRSEDGGMTWQPPVTINPGFSCDHPQLAVDQTTGRHAGAVYVGAACPQDPGGRNEWDISVFRSRDDGKTFIGPVEAMKPPKDAGEGRGVLNQVVNLLVLGQGMLFVGAVDQQGDIRREIRCVVSEDGGQTFSDPMRVETVAVDRSSGQRSEYPVFAAGTKAGRFEDRLYAAWGHQRLGRSQVVVSHSADHGRSWSTPLEVDPSVPQNAHQYLPAIAVNNLGTVGIAWYDTRGAGPGGVHSEFFAASVDGGASFLPAVEVSSREAYPQKDGVLLVANTPRLAKAKGVMRLRLIERGKSWYGHYQGLAAAADGTFHPFWSDTRTGNYQIWTSRVVVEGDEKKVDVRKVNAVVTDKVRLVIDPISYDPVTKEATVPVRLENTSSLPLYPPILVEVRAVDTALAERLENRPGYAGWREEIPELLNAANRRTGAGAIFDFSSTLGDFKMLAPRGRTGPLVWKLKMVNPSLGELVFFELSATAFVAEASGK